MKKIVLDTNAYSRYLLGDKHVFSAIAKAGIVYMSIFVLGELYAGYKGGVKEQKNKEILDLFLQKQTVAILDATIETSKIFGQIKDSLKRTGTPLPINDVWIAAHAVETGSVIVTYDSHFGKIPGLRLWDH